MRDLSPGNYAGLLSEIEVARGQDLAIKTGKAIEEFLRGIEWASAKDLIRRFTRLKTIPSNVYGALQTMHAELRESVKTSEAWKQDKRVTEPFREDNRAFWKVSMFAFEHFPRHVAAYAKDGRLVFATFEQWEKAGKPAHWKRILLHITDNPEWERAVSADEMNGGDTYCADYLNRYYNALTSYLEQINESKKRDNERKKLNAATN